MQRSASAASFGFQAGGQSRALIYMFMTKTALDKFRASSGWDAGADAAAVFAKKGAQGAVDTHVASAEIVIFPLTNAGPMAAAAISGSNITKMDP